MTKQHALQQGADESVVDGAVDVVEDLAVDVVDVAAATSRTGIRLIAGTFRFIARHPRGVLAGLALVVALGAIANFAAQRDATDS